MACRLQLSYHPLSNDRGVAMRIASLLIVACLALVAPSGPMSLVMSVAAEVPAPIVVGDLEITAYRAKAMLPGQPVGGGYLTIANKSAAPDKLMEVTSPSAGMVEVHVMEMANDVMTMRPLEGGLEIPAGGTVELKPAGTHLMFMMVTEPFKEGSEVPVTLEFEKAGKVELKLPVTGLGG
jgi:periplasmic copper chaperone A